MTGVMSLKTIPGLGKSGMSRTNSARSTALMSCPCRDVRAGEPARPSLLGPSSDDLAQVADQQQVLEVRRDRREVLERLDGLLAALGVPRAQRRREDLLEQRGLAVGAGAEDAQVAPADAVAGQLGDGADDLALGLVEVGRAGALLALDDAVLLELLDQPRLGARVLDDVVERVQRAAAADADARAAARGPVAGGLGDLAAVLLGAPAGQL